LSLEFEINAASGDARAGHVIVRGREFETPAFMPVATRGTVKCLEMCEVEALNYQLVLMNAYHLHQRPGEEVISSLGGIHEFSGYRGAVLTDSGGYQLYSFGRGAKIDEHGAAVSSPYDGKQEFLTPEEVIDIQLKISSDIMMPLDVCLPADAKYDSHALAMMRTANWLALSARRWRDAAHADPGALFGIVQGGVNSQLREESLRLCIEQDLPGYALGGLSVGESRDDFERILRQFGPRMPLDKPRYLMGVGTPLDILTAVDSGIDMFDCVLPTRNARNGMAFTSAGRINLLNAEYKTASGPIDPQCSCRACTRYPLAYIAHLMRLKEITGLKLLTLHNLTFYKKLVDEARWAIVAGSWPDYFAEHRARFVNLEEERRERIADD